MSLPRIGLIAAVALVFALGVVMIFNTSSAEVLDNSLKISTHHAFIRHLFYAVLGAGLGALTWLIGYQTLLRLSIPLLVLFSVFLILVFVPGIGLTVNGASRWIRLGPYTMQPSEFIKFLVPAAFLQIILGREVRLLTLIEFLKILGLLAIPIALIMLEPDNGSVLIIGITLAGLFLLTGVPRKYWVIPMVALGLVAVVAAVNMPYVSSRLEVYLNPELDVRGRGHQPLQAKIAAGSGGLMGRGPGMSLQKLSYLPEAQNDYIAAIYAEEFGFLGIMMLIVLYMTILYFGFYIAMRAPDRAGAYLGGMITYLLGIQVFLNLGVVSGLLPSTGLNLPFFSQGGTSLIVNTLGIGVLLNIARQSEELSASRPVFR